MDEDDMTFDQLREQMLAGRPTEIAPGPPPTISTSSSLVIESNTLNVFVGAVSASRGYARVPRSPSNRSWAARQHTPVS